MILFLLVNLVLCQTRVKEFAPYFKTALQDQILEFDAFNINTMIEYRIHYLPDIIVFDPNDGYTLTIEGLDNNYMMFDKSMNKFVFQGLTINNVGKRLVKIKLASVSQPELENWFQFYVIVNDITVDLYPPIEDYSTSSIGVVDNVWSVTVTENVAT